MLPLVLASNCFLSIYNVQRIPFVAVAYLIFYGMGMLPQQKRIQTILVYCQLPELLLFRGILKNYYK